MNRLVKAVAVGLLALTPLAHAGEVKPYQVCGKNVTTKIVACSPYEQDKAVAATVASAMNDSMAENGIADQVKFYVQKFSKKNISENPTVLFPKRSVRPSAPVIEEGNPANPAQHV